MSSTGSQTEIAKPSLISTIRAGFETVANHLVLVLFPVTLDLIIWLGPHYQLKSLIKSLASDALVSIDPGVSESAQAIQLTRDFWNFVADHFNLTSLLRSFPVGVPSLMSGRSPAVMPGGAPVLVDIPSIGYALFLLALFTLIGLSVGTFYYTVTAQASLSGKVNWLNALRSWPWSTMQVVALALFWILLFLVVSIPTGCILSVIVFGNFPMGELILFLYFGFLLWFFMPLFLSAHGIFVYRLKLKDTILRSIQITRWSLPATGLFFLVVLLITQGLDIVWNWPVEDSWITLIGLAGHGLVTSALLASSFIYYRQTDLWIQKRLGMIA